MKILFFAITLATSFSFATSNPDLICYDSNNINNFSINTRTQEVTYNQNTPVVGVVFSGVHSGTNYNGEIVGEINFKRASHYITLIVRGSQKSVELEARWYPKNSNSKVKELKSFYDCVVY